MSCADFFKHGLGFGRARLAGLRHPEGVDLGVVVEVFAFGLEVLECCVASVIRIGRVAQADHEVSAAGSKGVGSVRDEDKAGHLLLVSNSAHVGA